MNFVTYYDLIKDISDNISVFPDDIDIVVGIPRSGMMVANIISLYLNKPLSDLDSFLDKRFYRNGTAKKALSSDFSFGDIKNVLIVEDSVFKGRSITKAKQMIGDSDLCNLNYTFFAAYVSEEKKREVDLYYRVIEQPRIFEWNYLQHPGLLNCCVDLDGVLCNDPSKNENDDDKRYLGFLEKAEVKFYPTEKIGYIVTSRLEKYRKQTENWLKTKNIQYEKLVMMDLDSAQERQRLNNHADFKARWYKEFKNSDLFIESNGEQAKRINELTGKAVFCPTSHVFYGEDGLISAKRKAESNVKGFLLGAKRIVKKMLPDSVYQMIKKLIKK